MKNRFIAAAAAGITSLAINAAVPTQYITANKAGFAAIAVIAALIYAVYIYGYVTLAQKHNLSRLLYASWTWLVSGAALTLSIPLVWTDSGEPSVLTILFGLLTGLAIALTGWLISNEKERLGSIAFWLGSSLMISGALVLGGVPIIPPIVFILVDTACYVFAIILFLREAGILKRR